MIYNNLQIFMIGLPTCALGLPFVCLIMPRAIDLPKDEVECTLWKTAVATEKGVNRGSVRSLSTN